MRVTSSWARRLALAVAAGLTTAVSLGLLPSPWDGWAAVLVAAVGGGAVWPATAPIPARHVAQEDPS